MKKKKSSAPPWERKRKISQKQAREIIPLEETK